MRRILLRTLAALLIITAVTAVVAAGLVARGSGSAITRPRLERALATTFGRLYVQQADLLGHGGVTVTSLDARAMCDKHGPQVADVGPGGDWTCLMSWQDPTLPMPAEGYGKFELNVHSNACFTATGPSKLIGFLTLTDVAGQERTNPVFEFDGCFDPHGLNAPTDVSFPSLLNVTTTALTLRPDRTSSVQLSCGMGDGGCAGTLKITVDGAPLASMPYALAEESTRDIPVPAVPSGAQTVQVAITRTAGTGSTSPVVIPVSAMH